MTINKHAAADAIRQAIRPYRILNEYADELEKLGSLEQAAEEAKRNADSARSELEKVKGHVAKAKEELDALHKTVEEGAKMNGALAQETITRANADAAEIMEKAKSQAATIVSDAITKGQKEEQTLKQRVQDLHGQAKALDDYIAQLGQLRSDKQGELDDLESKLENARSRIAALLK